VFEAQLFYTAEFLLMTHHKPWTSLFKIGDFPEDPWAISRQGIGVSQSNAAQLNPSSNNKYEGQENMHECQ
jgi:hypothetical protein